MNRRSFIGAGVERLIGVAEANGQGKTGLFLSAACFSN